MPSSFFSFSYGSSRPCYKWITKHNRSGSLHFCMQSFSVSLRHAPYRTPPPPPYSLFPPPQKKKNILYSLLPIHPPPPFSPTPFPHYTPFPLPTSPLSKRMMVCVMFQLYVCNSLCFYDRKMYLQYISCFNCTFVIVCICYDMKMYLQYVSCFSCMFVIVCGFYDVKLYPQIGVRLHTC